MSRRARRGPIVCATAAAWLVALPPADARGAANVSLSHSFFSADASCENPVYQLSGTADFTTDDGEGVDSIGVIWYDAHFRIIDNDFFHLPLGGAGVPFTGFGDYVVASRFGQRPLKARVFDVGDTSGATENSPDGQALTVNGTLLAELEIDPAGDAPQCAGVGLGPNVRVQSAANAASTSFIAPADVELEPGSTTLRVILPEPLRVAALFSAQCLVAALEDVFIDLEMNGTPMLPTSSQSLDAGFCRGISVAGTPRIAAFGDFSTGAYDFGATASAGLANPLINLAGSSTTIFVPEPHRELLLVVGISALGLLSRRRLRRLGAGALLVAGTLGGVAAPDAALADMQIKSASSDPVLAFSDGATHTLDIGGDAGGGTILTVTVTSASRLTVVFSADCSAPASSSAFVDIDIVVDSVPVSPTNAATIFCRSHGGTQLNRWMSFSQNVVVDVGPGAHDIEVDARLDGWLSGDRFLLDEIHVTLIVTPGP